MACSDEHAGKQVQCPQCGSVNHVPARPGAAAPSAPAYGMRMGHYRLVRKIGEGGMGSVFEAIQDGLNRKVALKVLPTRLLSDAAYLERFQREARAAAGLNHPNIVTVYDIGQDRGHHFFSMEYVDGESLQKRLEREGKIPLQEALSIIIRIADALDYAWKHGKMIHRDIKPDNILLTKEKHVKLADLGLAKSTQEETGVTTTDTAIGSPAYMAPEQARAAKDVDCRADIYSLGITLFHILTGKRPYEGGTPLAVQLAHQEQPLPDPRQLEPSVTPSVCAVIRRMCSKTPEERYQTPEELLEDLEKVREGRPPAASLPGRQTGPRPAVQPGSRGRSTTAVPPVQPPRHAGRRPKPEEQGFRGKVILAGILLAIGAGIAAAVFFDKNFGRPSSPPSTGSNNPAFTSPSLPPDLVSPATSSTTPAAPVALPPQETAPPTPVATEKPPAESGSLSGMFSYAEKYAEQNPTDFGEILNRFETVKERGLGTEYEFQAEDQAKKWRAKWDAAASAELEKRRKEAERLSQEGRFDEAAKLWKEFPGGLRTASAAASVEGETKKLAAAIDALTKDLEAQVEALVAKEAESLNESQVQNLDTLKSKVDLLLNKNPGPAGSATDPSKKPESAVFAYSDDQRQALATMAEKIQAAQQNARAGQRAKVYEDFWKKYAQFMKEKKFNEAKSLVKSSRAAADPAVLEQHLKDVRLLEEIFERVDFNLESLIGRTVRSGEGSMKIRDVQGGKLIATDAGGGHLELGAESLEPELILDLSLKSETDVKSIAYQKALFCFFLGPKEQLGKAIEAAKALSVDFSLYESRLVPILIVTSDPPGAAVEIEPRPEAKNFKPETPLRLEVQKNTVYSITFSKEGFESLTRKVRVKNEGQYTAHAPLKKAKWPPAFLEDFEILSAQKDGRGNPIRKGTDKKTGYPLEVRLKETGMQLVLILAGSFAMGSPENERERGDDELQHPVKLTQPFYIGKYEVSHAEFKRFIQKTDYKTEAENGRGGHVLEGGQWVARPEVNWKKPNNESSDDHPVVLVSWNDAQEFLKWLNGNKGNRFHLPTEAQWEYACRAGTRFRFCYGDDPESKDLSKHAWFTLNSGQHPHPCGQKEPGPWNLYDVHGNVWEWCADWSGLYPSGEQADPSGPEEGSGRVFRGGSWCDVPTFLRSARRNRAEPSNSFTTVGFRVVRTLP